MNKQEFKIGQEVWIKAIVANPKPDYQGDIYINLGGDLDFWVNPEDIMTAMSEKPVVPKFVADWIEYCKSNKLTLLGAFDPVSEHGTGLANTFTGEVRKGIDWAKRNQDIFARAWLDGYEVEKEQMYTVELKANDQVLSKHYGTIGFVHSSIALSQSYIQFSKSELEQAGFGWVFDCDGVKVVEE